MVLINKKAQFKIQQMAFMLVAVFIFFTLVGLFFLQMSLGDLRYSAEDLERQQVLSALLSWSELPELSCSDGSSGCIDEDKVYTISLPEFSQVYMDFWPVASMRIYKVDADFSLGLIQCPQLNCNYYSVFDSGQSSTSEEATYVSLCKEVKRESEVYTHCEMATLAIGMKEIPN